MPCVVDRHIPFLVDDDIIANFERAVPCAIKLEGDPASGNLFEPDIYVVAHCDFRSCIGFFRIGEHALEMRASGTADGISHVKSDAPHLRSSPPIQIPHEVTVCRRKNAGLLGTDLLAAADECN